MVSAVVSVHHDHSQEEVNLQVGRFVDCAGVRVWSWGIARDLTSVCDPGLEDRAVFLSPCCSTLMAQKGRGCFKDAVPLCCVILISAYCASDPQR